MKSIDIKKTYCLKLANGHRWNLMATKGTESWTDKLASIMQLKSCEPDESPKLLFVEDIPNISLEGLLHKLSSYVSFPLDGWKNNKYSSNGNRLYPKFFYNDKTHDTIYLIKNGSYDFGNQGDSDIMNMWILSYMIYRREQFFGGLPFHAGLIELDGNGILIAANGGTGKSTCCRRIPPPWRALGDDQALIVRDNSGRYLVHPFPTWSEHLWEPSDKIWNVERYISLSAIFFLEKAEYDEVIPLERRRSLFMINEMAIQAAAVGIINMNKEEERLLRLRLFNNSCDLSRFVPTYILRASLHGQFWNEIEKVRGEFYKTLEMAEA